MKWNSIPKCFSDWYLNESLSTDMFRVARVKYTIFRPDGRKLKKAEMKVHYDYFLVQSTLNLLASCTPFPLLPQIPAPFCTPNPSIIIIAYTTIEILTGPMLLFAVSLCPPDKPEQSMDSVGWWRHTFQLWGYSSVASYYLHTAIIGRPFSWMNLFQGPAVNCCTVPLRSNYQTDSPSCSIWSIYFKMFELIILSLFLTLYISYILFQIDIK